MRVDIALPKRFGYINLLYKTFRFFHPKHMDRLYIDKAQRFYIFLERKRIIIRIEAEDVHVKREIEAYLENTFKSSYIGMPKELKSYFELKGVDTYFI